jgi:hypothetical protein
MSNVTNVLKGTPMTQIALAMRIILQATNDTKSQFRFISW